MRKWISLILLVLVSLGFAQVNTWTKITDKQVGVRYMSALVYAPDSNRFILSMGSFVQKDTNPYSEMIYSATLSKWVNFLPHDTLYGKWADSTGNAKGKGLCNSATFSSYYFIFKNIDGYLRPNLNQSDACNTYFQYAYDSDNKTIYYYVNNMTFSYNTLTRRWDTLSVATHPAKFQGGTSSLLWGAMCYDPVNQEVVLFGGGGVDAVNGNVGTWTYKPSTNIWTKLNLAVEPPPRCQSRMVYDAQNQKIILFGGDRLDVLYSDTWIYNCSGRTWTKKTPTVCPSPRGGHALLYLPKSHKVVLVGGWGYTSSTDYVGGQYAQKTPMEMWVYDVADGAEGSWKLIKAFQTADVKPYLGAPWAAIVACDTSDRILALADPGGYDPSLSTYTLNCDPAQIDVPGTATYGVASGTLGRRSGPYDPAWYDSAVGAANPDSITALLNGLPVNTWTRLTPPRVPRVDRCWGTRVYDPDHDVILVWAGGHSSHGGTDVPHYSLPNNRWHIGFAPEWPLERTYSNTSYPPYYTFQNRPFITGHTYDNYCYDTHLKKMVLVKSKYTYTYDPVKMEWDSARILSHAQMDGQFYFTSLTSTPRGAFCWTMYQSYIDQNFFLLDTATHAWRKLTVTGAAVPIYNTEEAGAAYDSKRDQIVIMSRTSEAGKVWIYDFAASTLTKLSPTGPVPSGVLRECVYLPAQDKILYAGDGTHGVFNCATQTFESLAVTKGAGVGSTNDNSSGYMYDKNRDLVWDVQINLEVYVMRVAGGTAVEGVKEGVSQDAYAAIPNPFNPMVRILLPSAWTGKRGFRAGIYDLAGRQVCDLTSAARKAGRQGVLWNGTDAQGKNRPSGVYFCVVRADGLKKVLQITLMK